VTVWVFLGITVFVALKLQRRGRFGAPVQIVLGSILAQGAIGYAQYFTGVPPWLVQLHVVGSIAVWCATVWLFLWMREDAPGPESFVPPLRRGVAA
jgi:cytochrome c oxidase assembly protein subunit 15